jgi:energy-coupling factor transporter ATP-binding protein EcfA2
MDFYQIKERNRNGLIEIYPDFKVCRSKDLMVRGKSFYAIWDEERGIWSTDEYDVQRLVDADLMDYRERLMSKTDSIVKAKLMSEFSTKAWTEFRNYLNHISDNSYQLDERLTFSNTEIKKKDYVSKRLPYPLEEGSYNAYDELIGTLYEPDERAKLEWAIGAVVSGDSRSIQKFIVLYGEAGAGKSTMLNIIQKLFTGYYTTFEAKALTSASNAFSTEVFKSNPLVAIQHDGDLSKIEDNTKLNSIISHEEMTMNEKYKPSYMARVNCFLFMATNRPVKITDAKSGIIRRLIDVHPSGNKIPTKRYQALMGQIDFELGAIASHCLSVYREMGKQYYANYRPLDMILQTDVFFNFIEENAFLFKEQDGVSLSQAYEMYKTFCDETLVDFKLPRHRFREELKNYFKNFDEVSRVDGKQMRSYYSGFIARKFKSQVSKKEEQPSSLVMDCEESLFDEMCADCPAQYASNNEHPISKWSEVQSILSDLRTNELHYVKVPLNHIVIDFDLKDEQGNKSFEKNIEAASKWIPTYSEISKGGSGIHLHYIFDGDVSKLSRVYDEGIEVKVFEGNSSLRRKLTKCNNIPVATINSGLPLKGEKMINFDAVKSERALRDLIKRNLKKEIHPGTKPSIDFIFKILDDAYKSGMHYDVTDMRPQILAFANNSSHQPEYCIKLVSQMSFKSEEPSKSVETYAKDELVFFDVEVFPNLFVVVWKFKGKGRQKVRMINPKPEDIASILNLKLVGFNCRRYDNHMLYARYIGYDNMQLFTLSQRIINESRNCLFGEAYNISYADVYDFSSIKQSLKKWEIQLGMHHQELGLPWDKPVPEELWDVVADYCGNDVDATEGTFDDREQDFIARQILADLSGLTVNDTTQQHTAKIMFGNDPRPQDKFIYTDLSEMFPGYVFENGKSTYCDEVTGEGGYVYAEPGMYGNVALLDVASMHPSSILAMNMFGPYTARYKELLDARLAIKHKDYDTARKLLDGMLSKYLDDPTKADDLAYALKIHALNIVYGLTSAKFENKFKDPRNKDNIVAKRGALFMIDLKHAVQERGFTVAHIKTDSIKIPDATPEIIKFVMDFGKGYGYTFEHEETYEKMCLVNDAVYIAKIKGGKHDGEWTATGAQFAQPYVFKTLFSKEALTFEDTCETKTVSTSLYLDLNEGLEENAHNYHFVGKAGLFCPIKPGCGGGILVREKDGKYYAATGSKGYRWLESEVVSSLGKQADIDHSYYIALVDEAIKAIRKYGDFEWFVGDEPYVSPDRPPWLLPCGKFDCQGCKNLIQVSGRPNICKLGYDALPF